SVRYAAAPSPNSAAYSAALTAMTAYSHAGVTAPTMSAASLAAPARAASAWRAQNIDGAPDGLSGVRRATAHAPSRNASPTSAMHVATKPARANSGQYAKLRRHQGSAARRRNSANTRASRLGGARRSGSSRSVRFSSCSSPCSSSNGSRMTGSVLPFTAGVTGGPQHGQHCGAGAADVGLDLGERDPQPFGDLLIRQILEVIEHQRHSLMLGQAPQSGVDRRPLLLLAQILEQPVGQRQLHLRWVFLRRTGRHFGEQPPAPAVAPEVIQRQVGADGLQPAARRRARTQLIEVLVSPDERLLSDVLRLRVVARQTGGGGENHVLIGTHERRELG